MLLIKKKKNLFNMLKKYLSELKYMFFDEMNQQTSGLIYGSAATDDWVSARSDLDVIIYLNSIELLEKFTLQFKKWNSLYKSELLDGFLLYKDDSSIRVKRFYNFKNSPCSIDEGILPPDQWKILNESETLFGVDNIREMIPKVSSEDLKKWASDNKHSYWIPSIKAKVNKIGEFPKDKQMSLNELIWITSGVARIKNLESTGQCSSKQDAIKWLIDNTSENKELLKQLLKYYDVPDSEAPKLNLYEAEQIVKTSLQICLS